MASVIRTAGRYELLRQVGHGGMAVVYLARQTDLDRFVALKELRLITSPDEGMAHRFLREARTAGLLSHPNIVTVHEHFEFEGTPYIAMEYFERGSLRPYVGRMTLPQVVGVLEGLLAGLDHATHHGVVHRDLKPENVMVTREGRVKIADFGIAKARNDLSAGRFVTVTGTTVGTPTYMAPEQAMAKDLGPYTDLYSVGVMAYEMLTGKVPFHDTDTPVAILLRHINDEIPPAREVNPEVDLQMSEWVQRLLAKDWKTRTPTAGQAWDELEDIVIGLLGSRWRRDARLPEIVPQGGGDRPLTPADFKASSIDLTPAPEAAAPAPASEVSDEFQSFHWDGARGGLQAPDAAPAAAVGAQADAAAESEVPSEAEVEAVAAPEPLAPAVEASTPVAAPEPEAVVEALPEAEPEASPEVPTPGANAAAAMPAVRESAAQRAAAAASGFVTFGRTDDEPLPAVEPEPEPEPEPVAQAAAPVEAPGPAPVAEPEPSLSALSAATIAPAAIPASATVREVPAVEPAPPRSAPDGRTARRIRAGALVAVALVAGIAGFLVGGDDTPKAAPSDVPVREFSSQQVALEVPASWTTVIDPGTTGALRLNGAVASGPGGNQEDGVVAGTLAAPATGALLPPGVVDGDLPEPQAVQLSPTMQALQYDELRLRGVDKPVTLFAVPTSERVLVLTCLGESAGSPACGAIATTLTPKSGEPLTVGPQEPIAETLTAALAKLGPSAAAASKQLATAKTRSGQSNAARRTGAAYRTAGQSVSGIDGVAAGEVEITAFGRALARTATAYSDLGRAAGRGDRRGYARASAAVREAGRRLDAARRALTAAGYDVTTGGKS